MRFSISSYIIIEMRLSYLCFTVWNLYPTV